MKVHKGYTLFYSEADVFSNWYIRDFKVKGIVFNCMEQFMMYAKAMLFNDLKTARKILAAKHAREHKALGRSVQGFNEAVWAARRERIVFAGCLEKFRQNPDLAETLLATGKTIIVEASPSDVIWGVGLSISDSQILDPKNWRGQNLLGKVLMKVRSNLVVLNLTTMLQQDPDLLNEPELRPYFEELKQRLSLN